MQNPDTFLGNNGESDTEMSFNRISDYSYIAHIGNRTVGTVGVSKSQGFNVATPTLTQSTYGTQILLQAF